MQLRRVAHELRPRILDDLGLIPALEFLAGGPSVRRGITVDFAFSVKGAIPAPVETAVYRLVQESITNISRHSSATRVLLELHEYTRGDSGAASRTTVWDLKGSGIQHQDLVSSASAIVSMLWAPHSPFGRRPVRALTSWQ